MMTLVPWSLVGTAVVSVAGGVWYARDYVDSSLAHRDEVLVVAAKADYSLTKQGEGVLSEINQIQAKKVKTQDDRDRLKFLREELQRIQQLQRGK